MGTDTILVRQRENATDQKEILIKTHKIVEPKHLNRVVLVAGLARVQWFLVVRPKSCDSGYVDIAL